MSRTAITAGWSLLIALSFGVASTAALGADFSFDQEALPDTKP